MGECPPTGLQQLLRNTRLQQHPLQPVGGAKTLHNPISGRPHLGAPRNANCFPPITSVHSLFNDTISSNISLDDEAFGYLKRVIVPLYQQLPPGISAGGVGARGGRRRPPRARALHNPLQAVTHFRGGVDCILSRPR